MDCLRPGITTATITSLVLEGLMAGKGAVTKLAVDVGVESAGGPRYGKPEPPPAEQCQESNFGSTEQRYATIERYW